MKVQVVVNLSEKKSEVRPFDQLQRKKDAAVNRLTFTPPPHPAPPKIPPPPRPEKKAYAREFGNVQFLFSVCVTFCGQIRVV